jgi:hypothetical protein
MKIYLVIVILILIITLLVFTWLVYNKKCRVDKYGNNGLMSDKQKRFSRALEDMADILDANKLSYFLYAGTALGCHREGTFIEHDPDIDLGMEEDIFRRLEDLTPVITEGEERKFRLKDFFPEEGKKTELCFLHLDTGVKIDIFKVDKSSEKYTHYTYTGPCNERPNRRCEYSNRFDFIWKEFMGRIYRVPSTDFLESHYGNDWKVPKEYSYEESITDGHAKSLL